MVFNALKHLFSNKSSPRIEEEDYYTYMLPKSNPAIFIVGEESSQGSIIIKDQAEYETIDASYIFEKSKIPVQLIKFNLEDDKSALFLAWVNENEINSNVQIPANRLLRNLALCFLSDPKMRKFLGLSEGEESTPVNDPS